MIINNYKTMTMKLKYVLTFEKGPLLGRKRILDAFVYRYKANDKTFAFNLN